MVLGGLDQIEKVLKSANKHADRLDYSDAEFQQMDEEMGSKIMKMAAEGMSLVKESVSQMTTRKERAPWAQWKTCKG